MKSDLCVIVFWEQDAVLALEHGCEGIVLSNHGVSSMSSIRKL
jgi:hypothetical protein